MVMEETPMTKDQIKEMSRKFDEGYRVVRMFEGGHIEYFKGRREAYSNRNNVPSIVISIREIVGAQFEKF